MIEKMKKLSFLVYYKEYNEFLEQLRQLGVVHIEEKQQGDIATPQLLEKIQQLESYRSVQTALKAALTADAEGEEPDVPDAIRTLEGPAIVSRYQELVSERSETEQAIGNATRQLQQLTPWGHFSPDNIKRLSDAGYQVRFHTCPEKSWNSLWEQQYHAMQVSTENGRLHFITVTPDGTAPDLDAESVQLPAISLEALTGQLDSLNVRKSEIDGQIRQLALGGTDTLARSATRLQQDVEFDKVVLSTDRVADGKACCLEGWLPARSVGAVQEYLDTAKCFYTIENATPGDDVPVKLHNGRFAKLFEPLTDMYSLPGYNELDPTAAFAPFFTLFFGLCLGDGGYGLLVFLACTIAKRKVPSIRNFAIMGQWLGLSTMVVGLLTGMIFGISLDSVPWPWLANVKHLFVTSKNYKPFGYDPMMVFAICIGILQILFAMGFKIVRTSIQYSIRYALSDLGWLVLLTGAIVYFVLTEVAKVEIPQTVMYVLYVLAGVCAVLILFFNSPGKNPFANLGSGLWGTYNMISGLLGDVLSYIRLFALGLAGGILGGVFNSLAFQAGGGLPPWIGWLPTIIILLFGHSLNLFLCVISSVVHPLRLTYVEFFKNAGYAGGGRKYKPFSKVK